MNWAYQTTRAIVDMHALDIVHGDIECNNIVVKDDDNVAIIDLGEGRRTEGWYWSSDEEESVEDYSPKPYSDIYGLGVVLWQLTDSSKPVHGEVSVVKVSSQVSQSIVLLSRPVVLLMVI